MAAPAAAMAQQSTSPAAMDDSTGGETPNDLTTPDETAANLVGQTDVESGESRRNENVQFDAVDNNAVKELNTRLGATATIVSEFDAERNYFTTEVGSAPSQPVHVAAPRLGGVHGSLGWTHGNSVFSARSFFQVGEVKPARENTVTESFALPMWKGANLSVNGSQIRSRGNVNGNILIPLEDERTPLATDPEVRAIVQKFLDAYPAVTPNRTDIAARAHNTNSLQSINTDAAAGLLEQNLGSVDRLLMRYSFTQQKIDAFQFVNGQNPNTHLKTHVARLTWNRVWSPATISDFSFGLDRNTSLLTPDEGAVGPLNVGNVITTLGPIANIPIDRVTTDYHYSGTVQQNRDRHTWTAGFTVTRRHYDSDETEFSRPNFGFRDDFGRTALENLRWGTPSTLTVAVGDTYRAFRNWQMSFFAGDHWRATGNLTLSLAVRYEPWTRPVDLTGKSELPFDSDLNNLSGSFGFSYRLPENWGVLRGAFGTMYGELFQVTYGQDRLNAPNHIAVVLPTPDITDPLGGLDAENIDPTARANRVALSPDLTTPYSHQYNFSWEGSFKGDWRVQLGYVGSRSHKLISTYFLNRAQYVEGIPYDSSTVTLRRSDERYYDYILINNGSRSWYDAARVSVIAPQWHGLSVNTSYWFSKALDLGANYTGTAAGRDARAALSQTEFESQSDLKALSDFDQPHAFLTQAVWEMPRLDGTGWASQILGRWSLSVVALAKTGTPFGVTSGSDTAGIGNSDGVNSDRPMLLDTSILGRTIGDPDTSVELLPRTAFRFIDAPEEMAGTLGRNTFRKGSIANINASLSRTWTLANDLSLTLRAESINLFNTPQFAEPGTSLTAPNFAQINNTLNDGRAFRFGLRFAF